MNLSSTRPSSPHFRRRVRANAEPLIGLREDLTTWLAQLSPAWSQIQREDIVLATYEALANAAEHAYRGATPGEITLDCAATDDQLTVTVTDTGTWKPATGDDPFRGRGLQLIGALTTQHIVNNTREGTQVLMVWRNTGP